MWPSNAVKEPYRRDALKQTVTTSAVTGSVETFTTFSSWSFLLRCALKDNMSLIKTLSQLQNSTKKVKIMTTNSFIILIHSGEILGMCALCKVCASLFCQSMLNIMESICLFKVSLLTLQCLPTLVYEASAHDIFHQPTIFFHVQ